MNYEHVYNSQDEIRISLKAQSSVDAQSYMNSMEQFQFIYISVISQYILAYIHPLSLALLDKQCDLVASHEKIVHLLVNLLEVHNDDKIHRQQYKGAVELAAKIDVEPSRPLHVGRQKHVANALPTEADSIENHVKVNIYNPFLDHILNTSNTDFQFR